MIRTRIEAETEARNLVDNMVVTNALVSAIPMVGPSGSVIADTIMARKIADLFGIGTFDKAALASHLATVLGISVAGKVVSHFLHFLPIAGWAVNAYLGAKFTRAAGDCLIAYFRDRSPLIEALPA